MTSGVVRIPVVLLSACLVSACSVTHQRMDLTVQGDVPTVDAQGRRLGSRGRAVVGTTLTRRVTAGFPCPSDNPCPGMVKQVSLVPIGTQLGQPPAPEDMARRIAPSGPTSEQVRTDVRHAYTDAIWVRYRRYAQYVSGQLSGADYVEVAPAEGGPTERYRRVYDGLDDAMRDIANDYAALEWTRFEREWGRVPVATGAQAPRAAPGQRRES